MLPTVTVDIGTTSVKLGMFDADGSTVVTTKHATPTQRDAWGEIYALDLLEQRVRDFICSLDTDQRQSVRRIAIAGVGESGGLVRADTSMASPMVLWHDHRGADRLAGLSSVDRDRVYAIAGIPVNANYGISKTAWAVEQLGGVDADAQWLNVSEWLAARLTGERWSEFSLASRTMALDVTSRTWSDELCGLFGLSPRRFPSLRSATAGERVLRHVASELGLDTGVEVHIAGHDHMVGAVGAALERDELLNSTGTTEGLLFLTDQPTLTAHARDSKLANGVAPDGEQYTLFASIPSGGSAFATLQTVLGMPAGALVAVLDRLHTRYLDGDLDLDHIPLVLPQFRGSPPPTKNAAARGVIAGIQTDTTAEEIAFGCFLGMVLQFRDVLRLFPLAESTVKVIGPASTNPLWQQLKADMLGTPLSASQFPEVVSRGAQALAGGTKTSWERTDPHGVLPDPDRHAALIDWIHSTAVRWEHLKATPS